MKKCLIAALSAVLASSAIALPVGAAVNTPETINYNYSYNFGTGYSPSEAHPRSMEKLNRGLTAVMTSDGAYLSWRLFDSEDNRYGSADNNVEFNVYRRGEKIAVVSDTTNFIDSETKSISSAASYSVAPVINGTEGEKCEEVTVRSLSYFDIPLAVPEPETIVQPDGTVQDTYSFFPADCSTGDLDGDGEYEIIVKWTSSERDVGSPGDPAYSGTVRLAAYKLDGTKMWENDINLGKNVYSSAHTVQFLVYDFDGDGKSEMMCQTSLGSTDAVGNYVSKSADPVNNAEIYEITDEENAETDYRGYGRITTGKEFLTIFNGETGAAIDTINLPTARVEGGNGAEFGDDFGNRSNRFLADVAYLDGEKPYAVYMRGYYFGRNGRQRTSIAGISFDGERLSPDYRFDTLKGQPGYYVGASKYVGNGNHNCTVADVDGDGKDEFITGALCMEVTDEGDFKPKWCTFMEHGDALHIGDYDPTNHGLEFFTIHEDGGPNTMSDTDVEINYGMSVIAAETGEVLFHATADSDTGRGIMANIGSGGFYQINSSNAGCYQANGGKSFTPGSFGMSQNFRIFWDGDLYDELLDGTNVTSWNGKTMGRIFSASGCTKINGTKSNPALQADLFGDWREELVYPTTDGTALRVFTTTTPTEYKIKTLMHDPVYRSGVAAQQTAYNQPPHVGFYMGQEMFDPEVESIEIISQPEKTVYVQGESLDTSGLTVKANFADGTSKEVTAFIVSGYDTNTAGNQTLTVMYQGKTTEFTISVKELAMITVVSPPAKTSLSLGQTLDTTGLIVLAYYTDGSSNEITDYTISGYDPTVLGKQSVTVTYMNKTASFIVKVHSANISAMNSTYTTSSNSSLEIPIGSYNGTFTLEHTVKINTMPANGSQDKNSTDGFLIKFMPQRTDKAGVGAGWYMTSSGSGKANIMWKADGRTATKVTSTPINIGEEYTFKYIFTNVGTGVGANVNLEVLDSNGNSMGSAGNLSLRNMTSSDIHKVLPLSYLLIYNQANSNSTASVTIDKAKIYGNNTITAVDTENKTVNVNLSTISNTMILAAKYDENGLISSVERLALPETAGESTISITGDVPDKIFLWTNDMYPMDIWINSGKVAEK